jgi:lipopolysaccharide export system protein LptA
MRSLEVLRPAAPARPARGGRRPAAAAAWAVCLGVAAAPALAERADRGKPMTLESDQPCVVNLQKQTSTCSGNVVISQGTMQLRAERLELRETPEGWQQAQATGADGKPARFRQKRDGVDETVEGQAQRIFYDSRTGVLRFEGAAVVRRLRGIAVADEIQGATIVWDSLGEQFSVQGGAVTAANPSGRVRAVIVPKQPPEEPPANPPAPNGVLRQSPALGDRR